MFHFKLIFILSTKQSRYLLPLKADVRKKEGIALGNVLEVSVRIWRKKKREVKDFPFFV